MDLISKIFNESAFEHDRFFNESFSLPYDLDSIKIQPNELNTYRAFNISIEKLYTNFLYIYGLTKMGNNVVPDKLTSVAGVFNETDTFQWTTSSTDVNSLTTFSSIGLSGFDSAVFSKVEYSPTLDQNILVTCSPTEVILTKTTRDDSSINILLSSNTVDINQNLKFRDIAGAALVDTQLFVCDSFHNNIYKYDLDLLYNDVIYPNELVLTKVIGGTGSAQDKYKFNNARSLDAVNDRLYVVDRDNYAIKIYDLNLNFINSVQRRDLFQNNKPTVVSGDPRTGKIFVATDNNVVYVFDENIKEYSVGLFSRVATTGETVKSFFYSKNFDNVYYIVTNKNVWKFYISKPSNPIGKYTVYRFGIPATNTVVDADSVASQADGIDDVYLLTRSTSGVNSFCKLKDSENFSDVLTIPDFDIYTLNDIKLIKSEYSQSWVFNKAIQKLVLNHIRLKDKIIGRFYGDFDSQNSLLLAGFFYFLLDDLDLTGYKITKDHFAGNNEAFLNTVVSRGLEKVYALQELMIGKSNTIILDSSFSESKTVLLD